MTPKLNILLLHLIARDNYKIQMEKNIRHSSFSHKLEIWVDVAFLFFFLSSISLYLS